MLSTHWRRSRRVWSLLTVAALVGGAGVATAAVAAQAAPPVVQVLPAAAFNAPRCEGTTQLDPTQDLGPVTDLTKVFGQRLTDYNNGQAVVLYDAFGENTDNGYPALCGTHFVAGVGAVSEWMFCTDIWSHVCSGTDAGGNLVDVDGTVIPGMDPKSGNPKLSNDQEKLVAYLIQNGHSYSGTGYYDFGATQAVQNGNSNERASLQSLVWCISDPVDLAAHNSVYEVQRQTTCADNMGPAEQARLLTLIPNAPTVQLAFTDSGSTLQVGDTATFTLTTNLYNQPIDLSASGVAGTLKVSSGNATITGSTLTVPGTDPSVNTTVTLGFTSTASGTVTALASALPASTTHIGWNQSPGVSGDGVPCQVFATFNETNQLAVSAQANATFAAEATASATATDTATSTATATDTSTDTATATDAATATGTAGGGATNTTTATETAVGISGTASASATEASKLAYTGAGSTTPLVLGALLLAGLGIALVTARRIGRKH